MPRPGKDGPPRFLEHKHATKYGLKVASRAGDGTVLSVSCQFCSTFGREAKPGKQRKSTSRVKSFQRFRAQNFKSHLEGQHPEVWRQYCELPTDELRRAFFGADNEQKSAPLTMHEASFGDSTAMDEDDEDPDEHHGHSSLLETGHLKTDGHEVSVGRQVQRTDSLARFALPLARADLTPPLSWDAQMETVKVMKQRLELDIMTQSEEGLTEEAKEYLHVKRQQILRKLLEE